MSISQSRFNHKMVISAKTGPARIRTGISGRNSNLESKARTSESTVITLTLQDRLTCAASDLVIISTPTHSGVALRQRAHACSSRNLYPILATKASVAFPSHARVTSPSMVTRSASHAGSWYSDSKAVLAGQLQQWLDQVPGSIDGVGQLPAKGARVIIAP